MKCAYIRVIVIIFLTPILNLDGRKKLYYAVQKKYKNQAGMNITPPSFTKLSRSKMALYWH